MRLARRASALMLTLLVLCAAASAQTLRPADDPRNIAPTVGTGGPPGGPTGLFTIYDGQTLRKGEFTFSFAYSNFDRDPGNVDITEVPVSFQIGLSDHLELFFNTDAYRGVKVNTPQNLSSFYLPNSQLFLRRPDAPTGASGPLILQSGPAIIQAPVRVSGPQLVVGTANSIFRPTGNQPFVQFPFVGGPGPNFGLAGNPGTGTGASVPFVSTLGAANGGGGRFGAASNFPGIGSPVGSILPGIVLTQTRIPANLTFNELIVPNLFTTAPAYLPDAPFINRLYGESSFSTHTIGAKIRFTDPENPLGVGIVPFYRWYWDSADDQQGFNQLQRGSSPGGSIGDFGLVGFIDARLSKRVNLSSNFGYILNSNPTSEAFGGGGDAILLDRPDELLYGIGVDFPINSSFQPILELKGTKYVGGRTPNAFPNSPMDFLGGVRVFPARWLGFSAWYRAHLNQQGDRLFNGDAGDDYPVGFTPSEDPHGFGFQFFIGRRNFDYDEEVIDFQVTQPDGKTVRVPRARECYECERRIPNCPKPATDTTFELTSSIRDAKATSRKGRQTDLTPEELGKQFDWVWEVSGPSKIEPKFTPRGASSTATFDFSSAEAGNYQITATATYACPGASSSIDGCKRSSVTTVTVERPEENCCVPIPKPTLKVSCPESVFEGEPATFTANISGGDTAVTPGYTWEVSAGKIISGQGTSTITVDTTGLGEREIKATVRATGYPASCAPEYASCSVRVMARACKEFDEYGPIMYNDEKKRLDNFAIEMQGQPRAIGYIVAYRGRADSNIGTERVPVVGDISEQYRINRALDYLVSCRGLSRDRIEVVDGGDRTFSSVELFLCESNVKPPLTPEAGVTRSVTPGVSKPYPPCRPTGVSTQPPRKKARVVRKPRRRTTRGS